MDTKKMKNKMIIVCGGRGKRMGKITNSMPKPLIKIGKNPIIEHKIKYYNNQGIDKIIFCLGYKAKKLKNFLIQKTSNSIYSNGGLSAGILKRIFLVKRHINEDTFISYGDTLAKINFKELLNNHKRSRCPLTIVVAPIQNPFGLVKWNSKNKATIFEEKPILNHFIGYAVINPTFFKKIGQQIVNLKDGNGVIKSIKYLIKKKQVNIYKFKNLQVTINSPSELRNARLNYKKYFTL
tara:strand:+ start:399 stop:1109 length:711 start_codon:yes stop_codon:yes gene_type:complete